jgi:hypothetical protein
VTGGKRSISRGVKNALSRGALAARLARVGRRLSASIASGAARVRLMAADIDGLSLDRIAYEHNSSAARWL